MAAANKDLYQILGVAKESSEAEIKRAYRKLAKKYHPDTNTGNKEAADRFAEVSHAYAILSDKEKRRYYDKYGMSAFDGSGNVSQEVKDWEKNGGGSAFNRGFGAGGGFGAFGGQNYGGSAGFGAFGGQGYGGSAGFGAFGGQGYGGSADFGAFDGQRGTWRSSDGHGGWREVHFDGNSGDMDDILKNFFGGSFSAKGRSRAGSNRSGADYSSYGGYGRSGGHTQADFGGRAGFGGHTQADYSGYGTGGSYAEPGQGADASAELAVTFEDAVLGADRMVTLTDTDGKPRSLKVHIPAGIESGQKIRLKGQGGKGAYGKPAGDLYITIQVRPSDEYDRRGQDIYTTARIPFTTAVLGGEARIHTLYGDVACKIKPGTRAGSKMRLRGKGAPEKKNPKKRGDEIVTLEIETPDRLSKEALERLEEFRKLAG